MADNKLKLLKCYQYDKRKNDDVDEERYTWTTLIMVFALYVYDYNGTPYIVSVEWYNMYYSDMNEYYRNLELVVYPVDTADVDDETKVRRIAADTKGFKYQRKFPDGTSLNTSKEETFVSELYSYVLRAIEAYLADGR